MICLLYASIGNKVGRTNNIGGKKPKKNEVDKFIEEHDVIGPTEAVLKVQENVKEYADNWGTRDNTEVSE